MLSIMPRKSSIFFCVCLALLQEFWFTSCEDDFDKWDTKLKITLLTPEQAASGEALLEGDIAISREDADMVGMKALPGKGAIWTNRIIPYEFHSSVSHNTTEVIEQAMEEWSQKTCVKFVPRNGESNYLRFRTDYPGCYTLVGRKYSGGQDVNLGNGCQHLQIAMHEIGHSLGFFHEHSRKDRDATLRILWQNIKKGMTSQFQTGNDAPRGVPYDVTSVMHYSPMAFSSQMFEKNTMVSVDPRLQPLIGKSNGITFRDAKLANILYQCNEACPNKASTACRNEGYVGKDCTCTCPPNTEGDFCEQLRDSYYGELKCGGDVVDERTIETPGYPQRAKGSAANCAWKLQAPPGMRVSLEFVDFSFRERMDKSKSPYHGLCVYEQVEIRSEGNDSGQIYCGTDIAPSTTITSTSNVLWILVTSDGKGAGRGLRAKVKHVRP